MTPREQDPAVWAAAFGAAFVLDFESHRSASSQIKEEDRIIEGLDATDEARACWIADAAVRALHPEPPDCLGCAKVARHPGEGYGCAMHPAAPADHLATLEAAERAYLLAADAYLEGRGWTCIVDRWHHPDSEGSHDRPTAVRLQRASDAKP